MFGPLDTLRQSLCFREVIDGSKRLARQLKLCDVGTHLSSTVHRQKKSRPGVFKGLTNNTLQELFRKRR